MKETEEEGRRHGKRKEGREKQAVEALVKDGCLADRHSDGIRKLKLAMQGPMPQLGVLSTLESVVTKHVKLFGTDLKLFKTSFD